MTKEEGIPDDWEGMLCHFLCFGLESDLAERDTGHANTWLRLKNWTKSQNAETIHTGTSDSYQNASDPDTYIPVDNRGTIHVCLLGHSHMFVCVCVCSLCLFATLILCASSRDLHALCD